MMLCSVFSKKILMESHKCSQPVTLALKGQDRFALTFRKNLGHQGIKKKKKKNSISGAYVSLPLACSVFWLAETRSHGMN